MKDTIVKDTSVKDTSVKDTSVKDNGFDADVIFARIKALCIINTDIELAKVLDSAPSSLSNWRLRNSIPYGKIINFCQSNKVSLDYIFMDEPFILINQKKEGFYTASDNRYTTVIGNELRYLSVQDVEMTLKIPSNSLETYIELCSSGTDVITPTSMVSVNNLSNFKDALYYNKGEKTTPHVIVSNTKQIKVPLTDGTFDEDGKLNIIPYRNLFYEKAWLIKNYISEYIFILHISDDTMGPTLGINPVVVIDPKQKDYFLTSGIYAIRMNNALVVRRLIAVDDKITEVICDNPIYPPRQIEGIKVYGKVVMNTRLI